MKSSDESSEKISQGLDRNEIRKIVEEEVERRVSDIKKENRRLKQKVEELDKQRDSNGEKHVKSEGKDSISRRDFLKSMGLGAMGAGALALLPSASAFNVKSSNPIQYFNSSRESNPNFKVSQSGDITGNGVDVAELIADRIKANNELGLPSQTASENKKIWVEEVDDQTSELKVRLRGKVKTLSTASNIPNSEADSKLIHRWYLSEDSSPFPDQIGNADATNNGTSQVTSDWVGGAARKGGGSSEYIDVTSLGSFASNVLQSGSWAVSFSIKTTDSNGNIMGWSDDRDSGDYTLFEIYTDNGYPEVVMRNYNGGRYEVSGDVAIDDGNRHRVCVTGKGQTDSDVYWFIDGSSVTTTVDQSATVSSMENFKSPMYLHASNKEGGGSLDNLVGAIDDVCIFNNSLTDSEATSYNSPWN